MQTCGRRRPVFIAEESAATPGNSETRQSNMSLIKGGKELHDPDRMSLTRPQISFVEPVGRNSKVAQLIAQAK